MEVEAINTRQKIPYVTSSKQPLPSGDPMSEEQKAQKNKSIPDVPVREPKSRTQTAQKAEAAAQETQNWVYVNGLGERDLNNVSDTDVLSVLTFDSTG